MPYILTPDAMCPRLALLDRGRQIAFGIFMLERALPGLIQFQAESGWLGEGGRIRAALAQAWAALQSEDERYSRFVTAGACEDAAPDSESYSSAYVSAAIDTVELACNLLEFMTSGDLASLADGIRCRQDTIDI